MKDVQIRTGGLADRAALLAMYRDFEPLGAAQGLPPYTEAGRCAWIDRLLREACHWIAAHSDGRVVGHAILAGSGRAQAEIAFFVHQQCRFRRIGTVLVEAALAAARELGYQRIWASVCSDNVPALRLLRSKGFESYRVTAPALELELSLAQSQTLPTPSAKGQHVVGKAA